MQRETIQKNKMLPHTLLAGGLDLDTLRPSILLIASVSQREDKKPQQLEKISTSVQHSKSPQPVTSRNNATSGDMQEGMCILSEAR
jgi:hypothetical protein